MVTNGYTYPGTKATNVIINGRHLMEQHESPTVGDVRAGMLVEEVADGIQPHSTAGARPDRLLIADNMSGRGYVLGDTYPTGETVSYMELTGGKVHGLLAAGEAVALSQGLVSAGDGTLRGYDDTDAASGGAGDTPGDAAFTVPNDPPVNGTYAVDNAGGADAVGVFAEVTN